MWLVNIIVLLTWLSIVCHSKQGNDITLNAGDSVKFRCPRSWTENVDGKFFNWENGRSEHLHSGITYLIPNITKEQSGYYVCRVKQKDTLRWVLSAVSVIVLPRDPNREPRTVNIELPPTEGGDSWVVGGSKPSEKKRDDAEKPAVRLEPSYEVRRRQITQPKDGSSKCSANQVKCEKSREGKEPGKTCIMKNWLCDGEDDCHNGWDEENCSKSPDNKCNWESYKCKNSNSTIPTGFRCDEEKDCPNGDDEEFCDMPKLIYPTLEQAKTLNKMNSLYNPIKKGKVRAVECVAVAPPPMAIVWRQNGKTVTASHRINEKCEPDENNPDALFKITSTLFVTPLLDEDSGYYTCEVNSGSGRLFSPDFLLSYEKAVIGNEG